jgi:hypothetical protein
MATRAAWPGDEGYDRMSFARSHRWEPIPAWGQDGWDLGSWPYVIVYHRGECELALDVEGDIDIQTFPSRQERDRRTDQIAFFYWKQAEESWVGGIASHEQMPEHLRGPFTRARHEPHQRLTLARTRAHQRLSGKDTTRPTPAAMPP